MIERLRGVLRVAVGRPAVVFLAALGGGILILAVAATRQPEPAWIGPPILGCLATAFLAVVQSLRVLWQRSLPKFLVLGSLILFIGILYFRESGDMALAALAWSPLPPGRDRGAGAPRAPEIARPALARRARPRGRLRSGRACPGSGLRSLEASSQRLPRCAGPGSRLRGLVPLAAHPARPPREHRAGTAAAGDDRRGGRGRR
jgi:hypothetical protein